jgi:hypothetical protein
METADGICKECGDFSHPDNDRKTCVSDNCEYNELVDKRNGDCFERCETNNK